MAKIFYMDRYKSIKKPPLQGELDRLRKIYQQLPQVECKQCGKCCVTPQCTLIEFIYLINYLCSSFSKNEITKILTSTMNLHPEYENHFLCRFQGSNKKCLVHKGRTFICRVHGLPVLDLFNIGNLDNCHLIDREKSSSMSLKKFKHLIDGLVKLEQQVYDGFQAPLYISALNIESWISIYMCKKSLALRYKKLAELQKILHENVDLNFLKKDYNDQIRFYELVEEIIMAYNDLCLERFMAAIARLKKILNKYPYTYYYHAPIIYTYLASCYNAIGSISKAKESYELFCMFR